jgi:hypothetical protein
MIALTVATLFLMTSFAYAQEIEKGQLEATGQIGFVSGIGTHAAVGASVAGGLSDRFLVSGEFLYIPLGSSTVTILGNTTSVSARAYNVDGGVQFLFQKYGSIVPYAGAGLGLLHSSASVSSTFSFQGFNFSTGGSSNDFYANFGGGVRYFVTPQWGIRPELTIFAGSNTFVRIGAGVFYQFSK